MSTILLVVPQDNELHPILNKLDRLGHPSEAIDVGHMRCHSIPSLRAVAALGGHGKAQFAVQCQYMISRLGQPDALFCLGAAGSLAPDVHFGDVVVGQCTIEYDYKERFEPAAPPSHLPDSVLLDEFRKAAEATFSFQIHFGSIASGDEDIVDRNRANDLHEFTHAKCVAWEGSGGARAAKFNGIPFMEIRCITDDADAQAAASFHANCEHVLPNIAELLVRWRAT